MIETYIDTAKMRSCGNDILNQVEELKKTINEMFFRISNVPQNTKEWVGDSAVDFAKYANRDKAQYLAYADSLYQYGKYLIACADDYDRTIATMRRG